MTVTEVLSPAPVAADESEQSFDDLGLPAPLLAAISDLGYALPTAIQAAAIPALLNGRDITGIAQTGTGKTAAFGLPLLAAVEGRQRNVQALVLTPTRELALQVSEALRQMAAHLPDVQVLAVYGGASYVPQLRALSSGVQVVVGTPGRVIDHLERGTLRLDQLRFLVLDEADEMLRMGFAEDVDRILRDAPKTRQTALFSATMPAPIRRVAAEHLTDPVDVAVTRQASTVEGVRQSYAVVPFSKKTEALARILETSDADGAIVFTRTKDSAETVGTDLIARGISAATISGDVAQRERERIVERLRSGLLDVLVATDVAARGLDVERIDLVVNYDAPGEPETYVHRIGRTGRAGRAGTALTFFTPRELSKLRVIEKLTRTQLTEVPLPTATEVGAARARKALAKATQRATLGGLDRYRAAVEEYLAEHSVSATDLAATLAAVVASDATRSTNEPEHLLDTPSRSAGGTRGANDGVRRSAPPQTTARRLAKAAAGGGSKKPTGTRYRVAVGHRDGVRPAGIVGAITGEGGLRGSDLGRIDIYDTHSVVEINADMTPDAFSRIAAARVSGRELRIKRHYES